MKQTRRLCVKGRMDFTASSRHEMLNQDLQIVRVTLATILGEVRGFSARAANAIEEALAHLDCAQQEFVGEPAADDRRERGAPGFPTRNQTRLARKATRTNQLSSGGASATSR